MDSLQCNPAMLSGVTLDSLPPTGVGPPITGAVTVPWGNPQTETQKRMTGLTSHTAYVVEISLDPTFPANETMTDTGWTIEPDVVRMGIRKVTETEATVTAVMDHPNGKDYGLGCQSQLADVDGYWSPVTSTPMDGYIGSTPMQSLTANEDYEYRCRLQWDVGAFGPYGRRLEGKSTRSLGTDLALAEISAATAGTVATNTVALVNTDGTNYDVYLRHRVFPSEEWGAGAPKATTTDTALFIVSNLANDTVQEFEASLDQNFPETATLTLYLAVGNSGGGTTPTPTPTPTPDPNNNNGGGNGGGGGGTLPQNNGGGGGGFGGSSVTRNTPPNFRDSARDMRTVPENSEEGVTVGKPIMAWDPENDVLAFSLRGDNAEPFTIDEKTGQILVGKDAVLDYEAQKVHVVTLVVTDPDSEETTTELEIHLTDVKLPGKADIFDVANNHNERLEKEEVEAAAATYGLGLITKLEILFIVKYYYTNELAAIDFENLPSMVDKYDVNADSIIDRDEVCSQRCRTSWRESSPRLTYGKSWRSTTPPSKRKRRWPSQRRHSGSQPAPFREAMTAQAISPVLWGARSTGGSSRSPLLLLRADV